MRNVVSRPWLNPASTVVRFRTVRSSSPAPITSATASATSPTTRARRSRCRPDVVRCPPSLSAVAVASPVRCSSGASPKTTPAASATASVKASTRQSSDTPADRGRLSGNAVSRARRPPTAKTRPSAAPSSESRHPSAMNCRSSRPRLAPSADRTASSLCRDSARASSRLARFAHAISSTNSTAPWSTQTAVPALPTICACSGSNRSGCVVGFGVCTCCPGGRCSLPMTSRCQLATSVCISALAPCSVWPSASRPIRCR